jgi:hypothetical protein
MGAWCVAKSERSAQLCSIPWVRGAWPRVARVRILLQRLNVHDGDARVCAKPGMFFEVLLNQDVSDVLSLHLHQDNREVDTLKADRFDAVRIGEGAGGVEHSLPVPVLEGVVADSNGDDCLMLKVEPAWCVLLAL